MHGHRCRLAIAVDGRPAALPKRWVYNLEVEFGDCWASCSILEFRRATGLSTRNLADDYE